MAKITEEDLGDCQVLAIKDDGFSFEFTGFGDGDLLIEAEDSKGIYFVNGSLDLETARKLHQWIGEWLDGLEI